MGDRRCETWDGGCEMGNVRCEMEDVKRENGGWGEMVSLFPCLLVFLFPCPLFVVRLVNSKKVKRECVALAAPKHFT